MREAQGWMTEDNRLIEETKAVFEHIGHIHPDPHRWEEKPWFLQRRSLLPSENSERTEG
jgi:hypothetical protein